MNNTVYLNEEFVALNEAKISIQDRGFQFGDGIYEVIKLYQGRLFKGDRHLERLKDSAAIIKLNLNYSIEDLKRIAYQVIEKNSNYQSGNLYIQITRGVSNRSHSFSYDLDSTVIMYLLPARIFPEELWKSGVNAITLADTRWSYCNIKTTNLLPNTLGKQAAKDAGAYEGIFVSQNHTVREGTSSNIFIVKDERIITHPANQQILSGITREIILELAEDKYQVERRSFSVTELYQADEVFITSTTKEVLSIIEIDGEKIAAGQIGDITKDLHNKYRDYKDKFINNLD